MLRNVNENIILFVLGVGAMAEVADIVKIVKDYLQKVAS